MLTSQHQGKCSSVQPARKWPDKELHCWRMQLLDVSLLQGSLEELSQTSPSYEFLQGISGKWICLIAGTAGRQAEETSLLRVLCTNVG